MILELPAGSGRPWPVWNRGLAHSHFEQGTIKLVQNLNFSWHPDLFSYNKVWNKWSQFADSIQTVWDRSQNSQPAVTFVWRSAWPWMIFHNVLSLKTWSTSRNLRFCMAFMKWLIYSMEFFEHLRELPVLFEYLEVIQIYNFFVESFYIGEFWIVKVMNRPRVPPWFGFPSFTIIDRLRSQLLELRA